MNVVLVIFALLGHTFVPELAVVYKTEEQCILKTKDFTVRYGNHRKAICVPLNGVKNLRSIDDKVGSYWLTVEQIKGLGLVNEEVYLGEKGDRYAGRSAKIENKKPNSKHKH